MGFRGDEFVLIDDECLGDGQDDAQPLDTWLSNRLWGNTMFLAGEPRAVCWSPIVQDPDLASVTGIKPYAIRHEWATVWSGLMMIYPGQRGLHVLACGIIESSGTGTKKIQIRVRVDGLGETWGTYARTEDGSSVLQIGRERIEFSFEETFIAVAPELRWVEVSMRSFEKVSNYGNTTGTTQFVGTYVNDSDATAFFANSTAGNPDADSLEQMQLRYNLPGTSEFEANLLGVSESVSGKGSTKSRAYLIEEPPSGTEFAHDVYLDYLTFWSPRFIVFEPYMDLESAGRLAKAALKPNIPVDNPPATQQVTAVRKLYTRPRPVGIGPRGVIDDSEQFYGGLGYRFCWPFVHGDDSAKIIIDDSIELTTENPVLEIRGWCVVIQHESSVNTSRAGTDGSRSGAGLMSKNKKGGTNTLGLVQWDFVASLTQLVDNAAGGATWATDATSYASQSDSKTYDLYPANISNKITPAPIARGLELMHQQSRPSTGYGGDQGGWFKEGSLVGDQDYGYLQPFTMRLDVSGLTAAETANPFRLKITAEHNQAANNDYLTLYSTVSDSAALVRFVLGHYVVLEVPR